MPALGNRITHVHSPEIVQIERGIIHADLVLLILLNRRMKPSDSLGCRKCLPVECDEVRSGQIELPVDIRIRYGDDALVFGQLDLKIVVHLCHASAQSGQFAVHKDQIAGMQIEPVVIVCECSIAVRKIDLYHRFARCRRLRYGISCLHRLILQILRRKTNLKCHSNHIPFSKSHTSDPDDLQSVSQYGVSSTPFLLRTRTMRSRTGFHSL